MPGVNKYNNSQKAFYQQNGRIDRILGDKKRIDTFVDSVELKWNYQWTNEFKAIWQLMTPAMFDTQESEKTISEIDGVITTKTNLIENKYYDIGDEATEHEFILFQCPKNGVVPISTKLKGINLIFQPGLDKEYKAGWSDRFKCEIDVTPTYVMDTKTGLYLVERPIEFVNSYVIFNNQNKANHIINLHSGLDVNYYFGKLGHLHAYCCYLPDGKKIWLESWLENGIIYVKIPEYILNDESIWKAGLRIGPTFGYTTAPGTAYSWAAAIAQTRDNYCRVAASGDTLTKISVWAICNTASKTMLAGAYSKTNSPYTDYPYQLLGSANTINLNQDNTKTLYQTGTLSDALSDGTEYCVAIRLVSPTSSEKVYYDSITGYYYWKTAGTDLPSTWDGGNLSNAGVVWGWYATYIQAATFKPKTFFIN